MRVLFDTNVVLDVLLDRDPHAETAAQLLSLVDQGRIDGVLCATTVTTIHYLASKAAGPESARHHVRELLGLFDIACVDRASLHSALDLDFADFEDAVLHESARAAGVAAVVTRNGSDFTSATLPVFDPVELLAAALASQTAAQNGAP